MGIRFVTCSTWVNILTFKLNIFRLKGKMEGGKTSEVADYKCRNVDIHW